MPRPFAKQHTSTPAQCLGRRGRACTAISLPVHPAGRRCPIHHAHARPVLELPAPPATSLSPRPRPLVRRSPLRAARWSSRHSCLLESPDPPPAKLRARRHKPRTRHLRLHPPPPPRLPLPRRRWPASERPPTKRARPQRCSRPPRVDGPRDKRSPSLLRPPAPPPRLPRSPRASAERARLPPTWTLQSRSHLPWPGGQGVPLRAHRLTDAGTARACLARLTPPRTPARPRFRVESLAGARSRPPRPKVRMPWAPAANNVDDTS